MQPRVCVLLLNWRGWRDTIECLESVFRQRYSNYRVVVCDNDSGDDSLERIRAWAQGTEPYQPPATGTLASLTDPPVAKPIAWAEYDRLEAERPRAEGEEPPLVLIRTGGNLGFAGGNNVGIRHVLTRGDADYVWLVNNDTIVHPDSLGCMVSTAGSDARVGVVGSKLLYYDHPDRVQAVGGGHLTPWQGFARHVGSGLRDDRAQWTEPFDVDVVLGASLLIRREVIEEVGLMDEGYFMYSEEMDWCWRARARGWRLRYAPGSVVWHKVGRSAGQRSPFQDYHAALSTLRFVRKNFPRLAPIAAAYGLYRMLLPKLVRVEPARALAVMRAYRDHFAGPRQPRPRGT